MRSSDATRLRKTTLKDDPPCPPVITTAATEANGGGLGYPACMKSDLSRYRWPKTHPHCVEECASIHVTQILPYLDEGTFTHGSAWIFPELPTTIRLVAQHSGVCRRWYFACVGCGRRCENLYRPDKAAPLNWRCRLCHDLIYASQRFGFRHPLRRKLTERKRRTRQKRAARFERSLERDRVRRRASDNLASPVSMSDDEAAVLAAQARATIEHARSAAELAAKERRERLESLTATFVRRMRDAATVASNKRERDRCTRHADAAEARLAKLRQPGADSAK